MDVRPRGGRQRPRPLDWVVDAPRLRVGRAPTPPPTRPAGPSFSEWLAQYWTPGLRVLEVAGRKPLLAFDALRHGAAAFACLSPPGGARRAAEVARLGWTLLEGTPEALAECAWRFDLVAWLREEPDVASLFDAAGRLLSPRGVLAVRLTRRLDARFAARWQFGEIVALADGGRGLLARKRRFKRAA